MNAERKSFLGLVVLVLAVSGASQWWNGWREREVGAEVASLAGAGDIHMLSSESCAICVIARSWFKQNKVRFTECTIESDPACRAAYDATGAPGTPVLVVRGKPQLGFEPQRLQQALQARG